MFESRRYIRRIEELRRPWGGVEWSKSMVVDGAEQNGSFSRCACGRCLEAPCGRYHIDASSPVPAESLRRDLRCARLSQNPLQRVEPMLERSFSLGWAL